MPKRILTDIVNKKRPARAKYEEKPAKRFKKEMLEYSVQPEERFTERFEERKEFSKTEDSPKKNSRNKLWLVAFFSLLFFAFSISFLFASAKVTIEPKVKNVILNDNFLANSLSSTNSLFFDLMAIEGEEEKILQAESEEEVAIKAIGTVVIFNSFGPGSQGLDIDTRLIGSNGKVYKTKIRVTVPGMSSDGVPGSVEVPIYAALAGEEYNSGPLDFQIMGFKGSPKYEKFKVRTKTGTNITGGFKGKLPVIDPAQKETAISEMKEKLRQKLIKKAGDQIPEGFVLFKEAVFLETDENSTTLEFNEKEKTAVLKLSGTLHGFLFSEQKLAKKIAEKTDPEYDQSDLYIPNLTSLKFSLIEPVAVSFKEAKNINFNLSGPAKLVWRIDEKPFVASLLGKNKNDFANIVSEYDNVDSAKLKVNPPWLKSIPANSDDVKIIVNYPSGE